MLTRALNASGFQIANGKKLSYDWLSNGWINENGGTNPPPVYNPAAIVDPNAGQLGSDSIYTGLLKCLFTAGMIGGNAGYYEFPAGGFDDPFEASRPKYYLTQMTALSQVQALFSYLESDVRGSDLLGGPNMHAKSGHQPAYEFPTGSAGSRVLARKVTGANKWIITAWAADGADRTVNVTIPVLGNIALSARAAGSVYVATIVNNQMQLMLTDSNAMTPTVGGYAPVDVTPTLTPNPSNAFANGGFETPVLSGGGGAYGQPAGSIWKFVSSAGIQRNGSDYGALPAPEGSQTGLLQRFGSMSQVVNFSAGTYKLQFQAARRSGQMQPIQIKIDGVNVGSTITPGGDSFAPYTSTDFTVIAGSHEITLCGTDASGDKTSFVDDVRIVVSTPAGPPAVANSGFETPVLSGGSGAYVYNPTGAGWNLVSNSGIQRNGSAWGAANAPGGSQTAFVQGAPSGLGEISQLLNLTAGSYKVQFKAARRSGQMQPIQVKIGGVNVGSTITPSSDSFATYDSATFTAPGGNVTLSLSATDASGDKSCFIDDVRIVVSTPAGASTLANNGFEAPALSGGGGAYVYNPSGAGWNFLTGSGVQRNGSAWGSQNAPEGSQTAFVQGTGEISQVLNLIAGTYKVQFKAARRSGQLQPIQVKIGGVNVGSTITPSSDSFATYDSAIFTAPGGNTALSLSGTDASGDKSTFLDDVLISMSTPAAVAVANSGFETPALSGGGGAYVYRPTGASWSFATGSGIQRNGSAWSAANAPEGSQTAFLQGSGTLGEISQVLNLIAGSYKVQFKAARRGGQVQPIQVKIGGVNVGSPITPGGDGFATYDSVIFTAPGGNATLSLSATDASGDKSSFIDDFKVF